MTGAQVIVLATPVFLLLFVLVFYDSCCCWLHRAGHRVAVLWAVHAVHHQSEDYNIGPIVYGTRSPLRCWNPLWANWQVSRPGVGRLVSAGA